MVTPSSRPDPRYEPAEYATFVADVYRQHSTTYREGRMSEAVYRGEGKLFKPGDNVRVNDHWWEKEKCRPGRWLNLPNNEQREFVVEWADFQSVRFRDCRTWMTKAFESSGGPW